MSMSALLCIAFVFKLLGVAMTVGRLEKPPYDEQVIQMLFDVTKWTEEQAYKWSGAISHVQQPFTAPFVAFYSLP